jgi:hypothetical protein
LFSASAKGSVICVLFSHKKWGSRYVFMELIKNDVNLLTRQGMFIYISKKLGEINPEIGNEMLV